MLCCEHPHCAHFLLMGSLTRRAGGLSREPSPSECSHLGVSGVLFSKHHCHGSLTSVAFPSPPRQAEQRILSRVHSLERRLEALAAEFSSNWQNEAMRLERLELRQGSAGEGGGGGLSQEDTLALLEGLVSRRAAALKEDLRRDTAAHIQVRERS